MIGNSALRRMGIALVTAGTLGVLVSCTLPGQMSAAPAVQAPNPAGEKLARTYDELRQSGGKVFVLEPSQSAVRIYVFRAGPAAKLGHNHVLSAPRFTGYFYLPQAGASNAKFDLEFRLDQLEIDNPAYRLHLGNGFSSELPQEAIDGTRDHMLGEDNLEADKFPFVRIHSVQISGESPKYAAKVAVELHGQTREMWVPLDVQGLPDKLSVTGSFVLRQTDFGAKPYSVLGGLIAVQDEVVVEFNLVSR